MVCLPKLLNQAVKRDAARFPPDFMFQLDAPEKAEVVTNCDHLQKLKFSKSMPFALRAVHLVGSVVISPSPIAQSTQIEFGCRHTGR
jgi:hypothetical protein